MRFNTLRKLTPPGIRVQLTIWYTIVSAGLVLIFGIIFYITLQGILASSFDTVLQLRALQVAEGVSLVDGKLSVKDVVDELPELDATAAPIDYDDDVPPDYTEDADNGAHIAPPRVDKNILVRIFDPQGHIVYSTNNFSALPAPAVSITDPLKGRVWRGTITGRSGQQVRVYSTMLVNSRKTVGVIQIGQSLDGLNATLQRILFGLLLTTPFILILSAFGSYWLAGQAFRPIHRLASTAREIGARDLHQRVRVPLAKDEVRDLAIIFNQMIGRLERAFIQQRRFVADASHELRTPVAVVRNMTEVALSQPASKEDYVTVLREVNAESERLGRLINDLLALARADEGQVRFDRDPVHLDLLATDVVESLEPLAAERKMTLRTGTLQPATVLGDAARLIQVIMSLVDNGLIYNNPGGSVTVSVETCETHAHLIVADTGIGIAQKDLEHIFERFYRADPARSKAVGGSGLGLAIVDWVVRAHKGTITVESEQGHGSTFMVTLPLATEQQGANAPSAKATVPLRG
jgi:two-component system OmpR family sensor kinase